jgi:3-hydroxyacyl-CoA dehydrogenase / enoyl-CoA hydratase / 3-hydroxybutyryl-CoA epimerase
MASALDVLRPRDLELGPLSSAPTGHDATRDDDITVDQLRRKVEALVVPAGPWKHWRLARDEDGIAWLVIDKQGASANTLSEDVVQELGDALTTIENDPPKALVIRSAKPSGFIAGADVGEFRGTAAPADIEARLKRAHDVVDRLDRLNLPTVAVIHGYCLGGGLEVALACDYRIAIEDARLGFPEVLLGLHPGLGGTVRLPRLINPIEAMTMMLTGRTLRARRAKSLGLVDAVIPERHVRAAVGDVAARKFKTARSQMAVTLFNSPPARALLAMRMRKETKAKAPPDHYPAPYALIDLWETHGGDPAAMQKAEIASFARLIVTSTAQNLVRVFFLREKMKKLADGDWRGRRVHVIGAGAMGGDIAAWCAWHGFIVSVGDMKPEAIAGAIKRAADLYGKIGHKGTEIRDALDRLVPDLSGDGVRSADLVIEAVPERLDLKHRIYAATEQQMRSDAILATNTSSIALEQLREGLRRPDRFVGLHFFNPVSRMQLVEVVSHDAVAPHVLAAANAFLGRIDRLPTPVRSSPGFLVNRALMPYMMESFIMLDQGIPKETIDAAAERFGMPMGPIELADEVGLDICLSVADHLRTSHDPSAGARDMFEHPLPEVPQWLKDKVAKGELGKKTGKGMYEWKNGKAVKTAPPAASSGGQQAGPSGAGGPSYDLAEMADRMILPMVDACVACLRQRVVTDEDTVDGAMIFGTGFAPFRGGPLHYARTRGVSNVVQALEQLASKYGERFRPDPGWSQLA